MFLAVKQNESFKLYLQMHFLNVNFMELVNYFSLFCCGKFSLKCLKILVHISDCESLCIVSYGNYIFFKLLT